MHRAPTAGAALVLCAATAGLLSAQGRAAPTESPRFASWDEMNVLAHGLLQLGHGLREHVERTREQLDALERRLGACGAACKEPGVSSAPPHAPANLVPRGEAAPETLGSLQTQLKAQNSRIEQLFQKVNQQQRHLEKQRLRIQNLQSQVDLLAPMHVGHGGAKSAGRRRLPKMAQLVGPAHNISRLHSECPNIRCPLAGSLRHRHTYTCHSCPPCQVRLTEKEKGPGLGSLWALGKGWCGYLPSQPSPCPAAPSPPFPGEPADFPPKPISNGSVSVCVSGTRAQLPAPDLAGFPVLPPTPSLGRASVAAVNWMKARSPPHTLRRVTRFQPSSLEGSPLGPSKGPSRPSAPPSPAERLWGGASRQRSAQECGGGGASLWGLPGCGLSPAKGGGRISPIHLWAVGEFWLGLEKLHLIMGDRGSRLAVQLQDWEGNAESLQFPVHLGGEDTAYSLQLTAPVASELGATTVAPNGLSLPFSTWDQDHDLRRDKNCAKSLSGGWWFGTCGHSNLNGQYFRSIPLQRQQRKKGIFWKTWRGRYYPLQATTMLIQPTAADAAS
nr:PREDICTED: angiopoietin-related protein 4 [Equus przewalskii]